jgi:hypothetical protein
MPKFSIRSAISLPIFALAVWLGPASVATAKSQGPIEVSHSIAIRNGDWIPLPEEDMRRAAGDAALSRLTDAGRLRLMEASEISADRKAAGSLALEITLLGPAETAKLTMTLDVMDAPTLVSTASISVRGLDHAGIYDALVHVGERAADRLTAKLDLLNERPDTGTLARGTPSDDPARRSAYERAQRSKRAGRYVEARTLFESVVASGEGPEDTLRLLAEDELRYGLPAFEAQQAFLTLGRMSMPGEQGNRENMLLRAENLYRQIQAENPSNVQRVTEAQRALDSLIVTRGALANAMRANVLARLHSLRMGMMEHMMMEDRCPEKDQVEEMIVRMRARVELAAIVSEGEQGKRYRLSDPDSRNQVELKCDDFGIEIVNSDRRSRGQRMGPTSLR